MTSVKILLRLEGVAALVLACGLYARLGASWGWFAALFLAPDLSMVGYARGPRAGARLYNAAHTYLVPLAIGLLAWSQERRRAEALCLIWIAHIGFDRALGYGLKLPAGFKQTHLSPGEAR